MSSKVIETLKLCSLLVQVVRVPLSLAIRNLNVHSKYERLRNLSIEIRINILWENAGGVVWGIYPVFKLFEDAFATAASLA